MPHVCCAPNSPSTHNRPVYNIAFSLHIAAFFSNKPINLSFMAFSYVRRNQPKHSTLKSLIPHIFYILHVCSFDRCKIEARNRGMHNWSTYAFASNCVLVCRNGQVAHGYTIAQQRYRIAIVIGWLSRAVGGRPQTPDSISLNLSIGQCTGRFI